MKFKKNLIDRPTGKISLYPGEVYILELDSDIEVNLGITDIKMLPIKGIIYTYNTINILFLDKFARWVKTSGCHADKNKLNLLPNMIYRFTIVGGIGYISGVQNPNLPRYSIERLQSPICSIENNKLYWNPVPNAERYSLYIANEVIIETYTDSLMNTQYRDDTTFSDNMLVATDITSGIDLLEFNLKSGTSLKLCAEANDYLNGISLPIIFLNPDTPQKPIIVIERDNTDDIILKSIDKLGIIDVYTPSNKILGLEIYVENSGYTAVFNGHLYYQWIEDIVKQFSTNYNIELSGDTTIYAKYVGDKIYYSDSDFSDKYNLQLFKSLIVTADSDTITTTTNLSWTLVNNISDYTIKVSYYLASDTATLLNAEFNVTGNSILISDIISRLSLTTGDKISSVYVYPIPESNDVYFYGNGYAKSISLTI